MFALASEFIQNLSSSLNTFPFACGFETLSSLPAVDFCHVPPRTIVENKCVEIATSK